MVGYTHALSKHPKTYTPASRYREHLQLTKRLICFILACLVQEDETANSAGGAIFNYGMTAAVFSAFENKV